MSSRKKVIYGTIAIIGITVAILGIILGLIPAYKSRGNLNENKKKITAGLLKNKTFYFQKEQTENMAYKQQQQPQSNDKLTIT